MAAKLTAETLKGIWAGVTLPWDERFDLDEGAFRAELERVCAEKPHGVYTTGSTGEFYALNENEFRRMVDIFMDIVPASGLPTQVGCIAANTRDTIRLIEYAADKGVSAAQVALPFWMELDDREVMRFFEDLARACPGLPLMHYNIPRAKRFLLGPDYRRLKDAIPALIGVKFTFAGSHFADLQNALVQNPDLSFFVGENLLVSAMQLGARGSCSSFVLMNPELMLRMYRLAEQKQWDEALAIQDRAGRMIEAVVDLVVGRGEGTIDPVTDKGLSAAAGFGVGHQRCRSPYIGWSDETVVAVRELLQRDFPEFMYRGD